MACVEAEDSEVSRGLEEADRDDWEFGHLQLDKDEDGNDQDAENDQTDKFGRVPVVGTTAQLKPEEEHERSRDNGQGSEPVDSGQALLQGRSWIVQLHCEPQDEERNAGDGKVDIEAPPPVGLGGEDTAKHFSGQISQVFNTIPMTTSTYLARNLQRRPMLGQRIQDRHLAS